MIKLKKIVAVALSAAMCLGLSMTAFAAKEVNTVWTNDDLWSPDHIKEMGPCGSLGVYEDGHWIEIFSDEDGAQYFWRNKEKVYVGTYDDGSYFEWVWDEELGDYVEGTFVEVTFQETNSILSAKDANGHSVDISWRELSAKTLKSINSEGKVADIFKANGYDVPDDTDFIPLLSGNITFDEGVPQGGGVLTFQLADLGVASNGVQAGETVYLMQETAPGSGVWEVYAATVGQSGDVVVTVPRNGAFVLVKTLSDGTVVALDKTTGEEINRIPADNIANNNAANAAADNNANGTTSTSSAAAGGATSPKTGEF